MLIFTGIVFLSVLNVLCVGALFLRAFRIVFTIPHFFFEYPQVTVFVNTISANKNFHWISTRFLHQLCLLTRSVSAQLVGIYYAALPYILRFRCRYFLTPNTCYLLQWINCSGFLLVFPLQMGLDNKLL